MIDVVILGAGNVASHLAKAFIKSDAVNLIQLYNRSSKGLDSFKNKVETTQQLSNIKSAQVYIIAVPDDTIGVFSEQLVIAKNAFVVHTSGSVSMTSLAKKFRRGVFYPLQTFSKDKKVDFQKVPVCIETEHKEDQKLLQELGNAISDNVYTIDSEQRKSLHVAAVFVNNFTNHLYYQANKICEEYKVPFDILKPLVEETAQKVKTLTPFEAQTGPAKRKDKATIAAHLEMLSEDQQKIYNLLTEMIQKTYGKEL